MGTWNWNDIASGIDGIDFTFYVPTEVYNLYNDFVLNNGNIVGYKYFGLPKKEDVYPFYTIENIDIKEGKDYILHVSGSGDVYIKRLAFSTFNGTRDDYDFVQEGIYDTSEIYFKNSYATVFHCTGNAQSMMLLIDQPNQEVSLSIYEYVKADYGFNSIYVNPIFNQRDLSDPTVWDGEDGYYYCLGSPWTNTNYHILRSTDLINWEDTGAYPFDESITSLFTNYDLGVWAPQVKKIENNWLMYISLASTSNGTAIAVCKSLNPYGKFTLVRILTNSQTSGITDSIDPCVIAGNDNHMYLFWGSQSGIYRLQLTDDGMNVATGSTPTLVAGTSDTSGGRAKIFEGAYLYFRNGYWYMFVSTGEFDKPTYTLKVVRSTSITGTFTNKSGQLATDGYAETVISSASATDIFNGPGHCGEIFPDRTGKTFIFYHSHDKSTQYNLTYGIFTIKSRALFIQEIKWDETNWPYVDAGYPSDSGNAPII